MSEEWYDLIQLGRLLGQVVTVTGSEPFREDQIKSMIISENGIVGNENIWQKDQILVIGSYGYSSELLQRAVYLNRKLNLSIQYMSQEAFQEYHLYGRLPQYFEGDKRIRGHSGLHILAWIGHSWSTLNQYRRLYWKLLPSGKHPFPKLCEYYNELQSISSGKRYEIERLEKIYSLAPDDIYVGQDEFEGYAVFVFKESNKAVLECPIVGNAIYIIKDNWKSLSQRSKSELLWYHSNSVLRIIHSENWFEKLKVAIKRV